MFSGGGMPRRAWEVSGDAGASPEWASVLAAVEALDDRASTPDGGIRAAYVKLRCAEHKNLGN
jgi:hypothetical protein